MSSYLPLVASLDPTLTSQMSGANIAIPRQILTTTAPHLPRKNIEPGAMLGLEDFCIGLPSESLIPPRHCLEYSDEDGFGEAAYQETPLLKWKTRCTDDFDPPSSHKKISTTSKRQSEIHHSSSRRMFEGFYDPRKQRNTQNFPSSSSAESAHLAQLDKGFRPQLTHAHNPKNKMQQKQPDRLNAQLDNGFHPCHYSQLNRILSKLPPNDSVHLYQVGATDGDYYPECQSLTMCSVFEDDSEDERSYIKKVLQWIPKRSKIDTNHSDANQKSRANKCSRSTLSIISN